MTSVIARLRSQLQNCSWRYRAQTHHYSDSAAISPKRSWEPRKNTDRVKSSNQLKFEMESLFYKTPVLQGHVDKFLVENLSVFNHVSLAELMRISVKPSRYSGLALLTKHLPKIALELKYHDTKLWTFKDIGFLMYGLQGANIRDPGAREIIAIMTKIGTKSIQRVTPNEQEISMLLLGLQNIGHEKDEVRKLLLLVTSMVNRCNDKFIPQTIGNIFYSLKEMDSDSAEVRALLTALLPKMRQCKAELGAQHVGNALYGMQRMHSDNNEVRGILSALAEMIVTCRQEFTAQEMSNALYGLQGMSSEYPEVRAVLTALIPKILGCREYLYAQHMSNTLYGLQGMSSDQPVVCDILSALVPKFRTSYECFEDRTVGNALYGLQGMSSKSPEVRAMLGALVPKVYSCVNPLSTRDISDGFYGLQGLGGELEASLLFECLYNHTDNLITASANFRGVSTNELFYFCQIFTLSLIEVKTSLKGRYGKWERAHDLASRELVKRRDSDDPFFTPGKIRSTNEERVHTVATTLFQNSRILLSFNGFLFGLFETDVVLKVPVAGAADPNEFFYLNIEMDGIYHKIQRRERFRVLRDKYLKSRGVVVERIDVLTLRQMDEVQLMKWLLSRVTAATAQLRQSAAAD